jgi:hypothetical protein
MADEPKKTGVMNHGRPIEDVLAEIDGWVMEGLTRDGAEIEEIKKRRAAGEPPKFQPGEGLDFVDNDDAVRGLVRKKPPGP